MALRLQYLSICLLLTLFEILQPVYSIKGPTVIKGSTGEDALFMWNTTDQKEILAVGWGIRKGTIPDPQFITVNGYNGKVHLNEDIDAALKKRVEFIGNLTIGRAWFVLKNLTVNDTNEYIASISDDESIVQLYYVRLMVTEKEKEKPTEGPSPTPDTTAAAPNNTKKPTEGPSQTPDTTAAAPYITPPPKPNSSNILRHTKGYMILMAIALGMWHSYVKVFDLNEKMKRVKIIEGLIKILKGVEENYFAIAFAVINRLSIIIFLLFRFLICTLAYFSS